MPLAALGLGNRCPQHWLRLVSLGPQFAHKAIEFVRQIRPKVTSRLTVYARSFGSYGAADFRKRVGQSQRVEQTVVEAVPDSHC